MIKFLGSLIFIFLLEFPSFSQEIPLPFTAVPNQPYFASPELMIDAEEYNTLILRLKSNQSGTARLFWSTSYDPQFNQQKSIWFFVRSGTHNYYFNIPSQNPNWMGWIKGILIYPEFNLNLVNVQQAKLATGNWLTNIKSGGQEFWGPRGRVIIGSTINTIQSSNLLGRSIFVYIYWLIILITLGHFALRRNFVDAEKMAFLCIIIFWSLLEVSSLFNNWIVFKDDLKYFGKSYRDKLVLANTGDFYPFIEFCERNIPPNENFDMRIPPIYNDIKARYYLYPRENTTIEAEYLVVYDKEVEPEVAIKYQPWQQFRDKAYIMRKK